MTTFWDKGAFFLHIPKNSGTSVNSAFNIGVGPKGIDTHSYIKVKKPRREHATEPASWYRAVLGDRYDRLWKFTIVRNPWDRMVSQYRFSVWKKPYKLNRTTPVMSEDEYQFELQRCRVDFDYWLTDFCTQRHYWPLGLDMQDRPFTQVPQTYWLDAPIDKVYRFETDQSELWSELSRRCGVGDGTPKHENASGDAVNYRDFYTPKSRAFIAEHFASDIEQFGYSF
jgi:chondroitin 4-sulfotransferase 11